MSGWQVFWLTWHWNFSIGLGCLSLIIGFMAVSRFQPAPRWGWFISGVIILFLALTSPIDTLGDLYLFSAHMLQHILLLLVVPPMLLLGLSPAFIKQLLQRGPLWRGNLYWVERVLSVPLLAWVLGIGTLYLWHLPVLYEATLHSEPVHIAEHLDFLVTACIFWWPIFAPPQQRRMVPLVAIIYLFIAGLASTILGVILTFATPGLYPTYVHPADFLGVLPFLRNDLGLTNALDQQAGGIMMWGFGGLFYLAAILFVLMRWYAETEREAHRQLQLELAAEAAVPPEISSEALAPMLVLEPELLEKPTKLERLEKLEMASKTSGAAQNSLKLSAVSTATTVTTVTSIREKI